MGSPSNATIKRLFAVSGNQCAFPKCSVPNVYKETGSVVGEICHIRGNKPGSARYDPTQLEADRQSFGNLVLLCGVHHKVVDDDEVAYTAERLRAMKLEHEIAFENVSPPEKSLIQKFADCVGSLSAQYGSVIVNTGHNSGQMAHSITNIGQQPRRLDEEFLRRLAGKLLRSEPCDYELKVHHDDSDGSGFASELTRALLTANWNCRSFASCMLPHRMKGIRIAYPSRTDGVETLIEEIKSAGYAVWEELLPQLQYVVILVGYREDD